MSSVEVKDQDFFHLNGSIAGSDVTMDELSHAPEAPVLPHSLQSARLPASLRFILAYILSSLINVFIYSLSRDLLASDLAPISRDVNDLTPVIGFLSWRFVCLATFWYAEYDSLDVASLAVLINLPHYYLLNTFYEIPFVASAILLTIDVASFAVPFHLFRGVNHAHDSRSPKTPNQEVAQDRTILTLVSLFGTAAYALVIYGAFYTWLPSYMIVHFDGLRSLEKAHSAGLPLLLTILVPIGVASGQFLFTPAVGSRANPGLTDPELKTLDPRTATLGQTFIWNLGLGTQGVTPRAEILSKRTLVLATTTFLNTFIRVLYTIEGTEGFGAAGWASIWSAAALLTGVIYGWVGNE